MKALLAFVPLLVACSGPGAASALAPLPLPSDASRNPILLTRSTDGQRVSLGQLQSEVTLVEFWASWCEPCGDALPAYAQLVGGDDRGRVGFIPISVDDDPHAALAFLKQRGLDLPALVDTDGSARAAFAVTAIPTTLVLRRDGEVAHRREGWSSTSPGELAIWLDAQSR